MAKSHYSFKKRKKELARKLKQELEEGPFLKEVKNLISAIAESIAQIVERDWVEIEIKKQRNQIEKLVQNSSRNITGKR